MGKREKILVGLMIAALLYGAFELLAPERDKQGARGKRTDIESARNVAEKISAHIEETRLSPGQTRILELAGQRWERDPFYRMPEEPGEPESGSPENGMQYSLEYTGYLEAGSVKMAIINGVEYRAGERLDKKNAVVQNISAEKVMVKSLQTGERITVPYKQ